WVFRPLPANAAVDAALHARLDELAKKLPAGLYEVGATLHQFRSFREYDAAANYACEAVWPHAEAMLASPDHRVRTMLLAFAQAHFTPPALARVLRQLVKDPVQAVRRSARRLVERSVVREVALPRERDGDWDATGWLHGVTERELARHPQGRRAQER